jgi:hypothetical protein
MTEAQQIAAQYRQRHRSLFDALQSTTVAERTALDASTEPLESLHVSPPNTVMQSGVSTETQAVDAPFGASLAPSQSPPIRRAPAEETETTPTSHEGVTLFSRVREDGTVSCTREDCLEVFPSLKAYLNHLHTHLIDEGYVVHLRWHDLVQSTDHTASNRLNVCEHCGARFRDDDQKDDHLSSCPMLPTFHESEPSGTHNRYAPRNGHPR